MSSSARSLILYRTTAGGEWIVHACPRSNRIQFDALEACCKARGFVINGFANEAKVVIVGTDEIYAHFEWSETASSVRQTAGPSLT